MGMNVFVSLPPALSRSLSDELGEEAVKLLASLKAIPELSPKLLDEGLNLVSSQLGISYVDMLFVVSRVACCVSSKKLPIVCRTTQEGARGVDRYIS